MNTLQLHKVKNIVALLELVIDESIKPYPLAPQTIKEAKELVNELEQETVLVSGTKEELLRKIWDGFLTAEYQDEHWHENDTAKLILKKLLGESPIEYAPEDVHKHL